MVPPLLSPLLCSDFSIQAATVVKWWQWQRQWSTGKLQLGDEPYILLQCTCTTIYQVTTRVKHLIELIWLDKQFWQKFWGNNFHGWGKIHENSKIYCPQKFPNIRYSFVLKPQLNLRGPQLEREQINGLNLELRIICHPRNPTPSHV